MSLCTPGPTVLASVAVEVVPSERAKGIAREMRKEKGRKTERDRENERIRGGRQDQEEEDGLARG